MSLFSEKRLIRNMVLTAISQFFLGFLTLYIQSIYPVWSAPFWPASGAALAAVLLAGPKMLWGVYTGLALLGIKFSWGLTPFWVSYVIPLGNVAETALAYGLLRLFVPKLSMDFDQLQHFALFFLLAPWLPSLVSAGSVQWLLLTAGIIPSDRVLSEITIYTLGNATGIFLLTPLILVWRNIRFCAWNSRKGRLVLLQLLVLAIGILIYHQKDLSYPIKLAGLVTIPLAVWGIWATGIRGATITCLGLSLYYFAFNVPESRPISSVLSSKQKLTEISFNVQKVILASPNTPISAVMVENISDQIGLLTILCITLLPMGVASDDLRRKSERDRRAMTALSSSFWHWTPDGGNGIENPEVEKFFTPSTKLFARDKQSGSMRIRPANPNSPAFLSHWFIQQADPSGFPLQVTGLLQNLTAEDERDTAVAQARLAELEIQTLRSHLNPHLLFNCLSGLRALISDNPSRARELTESLARFLRAVVDSESQKIIPLQKEMEICEDFVRLEELRGRPIKLQNHLSSEAMKAGLPPLTLVTLLENAAKFGRRDGTNPLPVEVSWTHSQPGHIQINVRQPGTLSMPHGDSNHAGLNLIRRHLRLIFQERGHLELIQDSPNTVAAKLTLPV